MDVVSHQLNLFQTPSKQVGLEKGDFIQYQPVASISNHLAPIEFIIKSSGDDYIDPSQIYLHLEAKIGLIEDSNLQVAENDVIAPVNNWFHSLFSQVNIFLNNTEITPQTNTYPYRAYLETLLNYSNQSTWLVSQLWIKDIPKFSESKCIHEEQKTDEEPYNKPLHQRFLLTQAGKSVDMVGKMHVSLFHQNLLIPNGIDMRLVFVPSRPAFNLIANTGTQPKNYISKITKATLYGRKVRLSPQAALSVNKHLENNQLARIPIERVQVKAFTVAAQLRNVTLENIFLGQLPKKVIIGLISNKAFNGSQDTNPFNFRDFNLSSIGAYVDGRCIGGKPDSVDLENNRGIKVYKDLLSTVGQYGTSEGNMISNDEFRDGFTLFGYDLSPDLREAGASDPIKTGNLRIEFAFKSALAAATTIIVYGVFDNNIFIDKLRNVITDY